MLSRTSKRCGRPPPIGHLKVAIPGPLDLCFAASRRPAGDVGEHHGPRSPRWCGELEVAALAEAGASYVQIDEPALPHPPIRPQPHGSGGRGCQSGGRRRSRAASGCMSALATMPGGRWPIAGLIESDGRDAGTGDCDQLVLEFANREMADVELLGPLSRKVRHCRRRHRRQELPP